MPIVNKTVVTTYSIENLTSDEYQALVNDLNSKVTSNTATPIESELVATLTASL